MSGVRVPLRPPPEGARPWSRVVANRVRWWMGYEQRASRGSRRASQRHQGRRGLVLQLGERVPTEPLRVEDLGRARRWRRPARVGEAGGVDEVDALGASLNHRRRLADQLDLDTDLLEDLTADGDGRVLPPLQEPTREAPPRPVDLSHQQDGAVVALDQADGSDR